MEKGKKVYVITMENDEMDPIEIGYASKRKISKKMIEHMESTDGFEMNTYNSHQATIDYLEINDEPICFEEPSYNDNSDLIVQFAMLLGMEIGSALSPKEIETAEKLKEWNSEELYKLFSTWTQEYLNQETVEDTVDFFTIKLAELLKE